MVMITVVALRDVSNSTVAKVMAAMRNGTHIQHPGVEYHKVSGFKLEPTSAGSIKVDGQVLPSYGPVRVEVHQAMARIICQGNLSIHLSMNESIYLSVGSHSLFNISDRHHQLVLILLSYQAALILL